MSDKCTQTLERLPSMSRQELQQLWQELFGRPPHPKLRRQLLIPILAYRVQEKAYGGLKASTRNYLRKLALQLEAQQEHSETSEDLIVPLAEKLRPGFESGCTSIIVNRSPLTRTLRPAAKLVPMGPAPIRKLD